MSSTPRQTTVGSASWHFITGEYPPQPGGVSDYCAQVAPALARAGEEVHVWAPPAPEGSAGEPPDGVIVHRLRGRYDPLSVSQLMRGLDAHRPPRRLFVQYTAQAWGYKGLNVPFCARLMARRNDRVWVMFHEYACPLGPGYRPALLLLGVVTPVMAAMLAARADRIFVSTPAWLRLMPSTLRARKRERTTWLPVPSNIPVSEDPAAAGTIRMQVLRQGGTVIVGHFGTYGPLIRGLLSRVLPQLLESPDRTGLLLGRGGDAFARDLIRATPGLTGRLVTTGSLPPHEVASHLRACDVLVQPYEDGATSRRGSLMAGLRQGIPIVTNAGVNSEPIFAEAGAVVMASAATPEAMVPLVEQVLASPGLRAQLAGSARALYLRQFSLESTVGTLLEMGRSGS